MSERTGLGVVEIAILEAVETTRFLRCSKALASVEERIGLAPGYGYEVLVDLARSWTMPVSLVHGQGNFGSRGDDPPANFRYTEARITRAGRVVLAAERGEMAPVPIALINGNTYREGLRPPFTGCAVIGSLAVLAAGRRTKLRLQAQVSISDDRTQVVIENIPPNISTDKTARVIASRANAPRWTPDYPGLHHITHLPLANFRDETSERSPFGRLICTPKPGTSPEQLRDMLLEIPGVCTTMPVQLPQPLPLLIRRWVQANAHEDLLTSLAALEQAIRGQRP